MLEYSAAAARLTAWRKRIRPMPVLLTVLGWPLVAAGGLAYRVVVAARWAKAAVVLGFTEARDRAG